MNKRILIVMHWLLVALPFPGICQAAEPQELYEQVIEQLASSQKWTDLFDLSMTILKETTEPGYPVMKYKLVFRNDHDQRAQWIKEIFVIEEIDNEPVETFWVTCETVVNGQEVSSSRIYRNPEFPSRGSIGRRYMKRYHDLRDQSEYGSGLLGMSFGNNHLSIVELLHQAHDVQMRRDTLDGELCIVIEGNTPYGSVIAWLLIDKGHTPLQWQLKKTAESLYHNTTVESLGLSPGVVTFRAMELRQYGQYFIPVRSRLTTEAAIRGRDNPRIRTYDYTVEQIDLSPDFDALNAFLFNLPEGTTVYNTDFPGITYIWRNGKAVPEVGYWMIADIDSLISATILDVTPEVDDTPPTPQNEAKLAVEDVQEPQMVQTQDTPAAGSGSLVWVVAAASLLIAVVFAVACLRRRTGTA